MNPIYEYCFYIKNTHQLVSSKSIDQYICLKMDIHYNPKKYSSLYESIIWFGISLYIETIQNEKSMITEEFLNERNPFQDEKDNSYFQKIFLLMKEIFIEKYDFFVKIEYE
jgi:hypothetical protein